MILCYVTDRKSLPPGLSPSSAIDAPSGSDSRAEPKFASLLSSIAAAASAGVDWVQLREKDLTASDSAILTAASVTCCDVTKTRILVNNRLDVALATNASGVHLGERSLPVTEVCRSLGKASETSQRLPFLVGVSCHSVASAVAAANAGAAYVIFGPVFDTPSKRAFGASQGLPHLEQVCRAVAIPVLAIGGITLANACACMNAGAAGVAAIRLFQESTDLSALVSRLRSAR